MAETKSFNLAEILKDVPKLDTTGDGQKRIAYIDIARLEDDPKNFYTLSDLDSLVENIELVGLQQPLLVRPDPDATGYFIIVSGHRRRAAIRKLVDEGREELRTIPCIVESGQASEAMQELRLIFANSSSRKLTDAEIADQADRVTALLYQLKEEGVEFPGRMRDHVAEACQVSKSKLARLKVIKEKLESPFIQRWQAGELDESPAYELARMPMELQRRIGKFKKLPYTNALARIREQAEKGVTWTPELRCPDGKPCTHADSFMLVSGERPYKGCDGSKCCLKCPDGASCDYYCCDRMCAKAKAARKERQREEKEKAATAAKKRLTVAQRKTVPFAKRVARAADAAGLEDDVKIPWGSWGDLTVGDARDWADGHFIRWPAYGAEYPRFSPDDLSKPLAAVKVLKCSADYLLGMTDDLHPSAPAPTKYITGQIPDRPTEAMGLFDLGDGLDLYRTPIRWDGKRWTFPGGVTIDSPCVGWFPIPDTPKALAPAGDQAENLSVEEADDDDEA